MTVRDSGGGPGWRRLPAFAAAPGGAMAAPCRSDEALERPPLRPPDRAFAVAGAPIDAPLPRVSALALVVFLRRSRPSRLPQPSLARLGSAAAIDLTGERFD
ncbi:MAG: hypothetical protein SNJ73_08010 [Acetobacteraceae bacterium]